MLEPPFLAVLSYSPLKLGSEADHKPYRNQAVQYPTGLRDRCYNTNMLKHKNMAPGSIDISAPSGPSAWDSINYLESSKLGAWECFVAFIDENLGVYAFLDHLKNEKETKIRDELTNTLKEIGATVPKDFGAFQQMNERLGFMWVTSVYAMWEHYFREKVAKERKLPLSKELKINSVGDLRNIRNDLLHNKGVVRDSAKNLELKWFKHGKKIVLNKDEVFKIAEKIKASSK